jgi:hypothetical protein
MAEKIPQTFSRVGENIVATFDFFELVSGTAFKRFNCTGTSNTGSGIEYFLTTTTPTGGTNSVSIESGSQEINFDTTAFARPIKIEGNASIHIPHFVTNDTGGAQTQTALLTVVVYHVDSSDTETSLGSETFENSAVSLGIGASQYVDVLMNITLTKKSVGVGEKLRISVTSNQTAGDGDHGFYFDPQNSEVGTLLSSSLTADLPFNSQR